MEKRSSGTGFNDKRKGAHAALAFDNSLQPALLALHEATDLEKLWNAIARLCGQAVPAEHILAALPYEGVAPMALRTTMPHDEIEAYWIKLHAAEPPLNEIVRRFPGILLADLDEQFGEDQLTGLRFYQEVMQPSGVRHAMGLLFWDGTALVAHVGMCRTPEQGRFKDEEKRMLMELHPYLAVAIRRVAMIARLELVSSLMADALEHPSDDGIALLDSQGRLVFQNQAAAVSCAVWMRGKAAASEQIKRGSKVDLPKLVHEAAMGLLARFLDEYARKPLKGTKLEIEIPHPAGEPVSARARVIAPKSRPVLPHVRIVFSRLRQNGTNPATNVPVYRLSKSEQRVAQLVARGMRNHEVAKEMGLSVNTVRAHLREIFSKLGINHRGQLVDRMIPAPHEAVPDFEI
jgi:DNA-binding CsgD family transcriptional regulator